MSNDGPGPRGQQLLGYLLKHAQQRMVALNVEALTPLGIDDRELGVLLVVDEHETGSQQQAAARLAIDRTTMVAMLDALERKGLVARRPLAHDRRRNVVELTDRGREVLRSGLEASGGAEETLLAEVDPQDARGLRAALARVVLG